MNADAYPLSLLRTYGPRADPVTALTWGLIVLSVAVVVIITALVAAGVLVRRRRPGAGPMAETPIERPRSGLKWISIGLVPTSVALAATLVWTMYTLAAVASPPRPPGLTLEVTGHQWWWEVRYLSDDPGQVFSTANEIHIPTGQPVRIRLEGADVIHSFWVPALTGKTDIIPGQTNLSWLQADKPGVYSGQCTEFCGAQHAHMMLQVIAEPPEQFQAWRARQQQAAPPPGAPAAAAGEAVLVTRCGGCHTVRGTSAGGIVGPDLTHLMSRRTIAAGALPNTEGALSGWIANPQSIKPGALMPVTNLSGPELVALRAYLSTLL